MPGSRGTNVSLSPIGRRCKRCENRTEDSDRGSIASDHEAVAFTITPDPPARPHINEPNTFLLESCGSPQSVLVIRVAAIDDDVARGDQGAEFVQGFVDDLSGREHDPDHPRRLR